MPQRAKMKRWYDPPRLLFIGIRAALSMVFGEFADRREMMVGAREIDPIALDPVHDYRAAGEDREFWFDFIADNGDGWNPTYAIARLLAEPKLRVSGLSDALPMGRFVVMGGDQVYPTASREDYQEKLVAPFDQAQLTATWPAGTCPDLYAVPGNHDWYDGLQSFLGLFCRRRRAGIWPVARAGRVIGGRQTQQIRSYFALKLPHNWWLWGADIQLRGYIDQPQIDFFRHVAEKWMDPEGSRLILCTGQPSWAYVSEQDPEPAFKNYS